jgi:D-3-phosphoglycerate dehydrogenase
VTSATKRNSEREWPPPRQCSQIWGDSLTAVPDDFPSVFHGTSAHERLKGLGPVEVFTEPGTDQEAELSRRIGNAEIVINIRAYAKFTDALFSAHPRLKLISVWGTGVDNIDLEAAGRHGVTVCNTAGVNANAVAEHALALMLAVARWIPQNDREMRAGRWPRESTVYSLHGKRLGLFGLGAIGSRVVRLGQAIGMETLGWSFRSDPERISALGARPVGKEELLQEAHVVSLHLRLTPGTHGFLGRRELRLIKPGAILVNTARAALVDRDALLEAVREKRLLGAGLDVFHEEPVNADDPLLRLPNVVLSPHNAGQTPEVIRDGLLLAVQNVESYLKGNPANIVRAG